MSITAKELAHILNLSEAAISMALNNKPGVSTQTRKKVVETAQKYGYDFSKIRENVSETVYRGTIYFLLYKKNGAVVTDTPFFSQLSEGVDQGCKEHHFHLNISYLYDNDDIPKRISEIISSDCKGIILLGTEMTEQEFQNFNNLEIPLVLLDTNFENIRTNCVLIDNLQGAYIATKYLIDVYKSQPGYLKSSYPINNFLERTDGFYKAIRRSGMATSTSLVHNLSPSTDGAYADMKELLCHGEKPARCYFADNDLIAAGAIRALMEHGYAVPNDIAVIGFDNMPLCTYTTPTLSTIHVPKQYMGKMAVSRINELLNSPTSRCVKICISTSLIPRDSA